MFHSFDQLGLFQIILGLSFLFLNWMSWNGDSFIMLVVHGLNIDPLCGAVVWVRK